MHEQEQRRRSLGQDLNFGVLVVVDDHAAATYNAPSPRVLPRDLRWSSGGGGVHEVTHDLDEALRCLALREVTHALEDLEAAAWHRSMGGPRVGDRDDRVGVAPDDQRGRHLGEVEAIGGTDCLPTGVDDRPKGSEESASGLGVAERGVGAPHLGRAGPT